MDLRIVHIPETDSTNRWIKDRLSKDRRSDEVLTVRRIEGVLTDSRIDGEASLIVWADYQTAGRGCGTNSWESERGKNLTFSMLLHPSEVKASQQFTLSMANALALKDTLDDYVADIKIKWPNDIYWKDRKICGTLIETTLQGNYIKDCIIGNGINVNQQSFCSDAPNPVSLFQILGHEEDCQKVLEKVVANTSKYMEMVASGSWDEIRARYRQHLYRRGEVHRYRFMNGDEAYCKLLDVEDDGHLLLLNDNGQTHRCAFKEVQFVN